MFSSFLPALRTVCAIVAVLAVTLGFVTAPAPSTAAAPDAEGETSVAITSAPALAWGLKTTWRNYAPAPAVSDGATVVPTDSAATGATYNLTWAFEDGSYDATTGTTRMSYSGTTHWTKYHAVSDLGWARPAAYTGSDPDPFVLDVTLTDPEVELGSDEATITAGLVTRSSTTWNLIDHGRIAVATLDISGIDPGVTTGAAPVTTWPAMVSTATEALGTAGLYVVGTAMDKVAFAYDGPGGAPVVDEQWDDQGIDVLEAKAATVLTENGLNYPTTFWWVDQEELLAHYWFRDPSGNYVLQAFDLATMSDTGEPLVIPNAQRPFNLMTWDTTRDRVLYARVGESVAGRWLSYDRDAGTYLTGTLTSSTLPQRAAYDPVGDRAYTVDRVQPVGVSPADVDHHVWQLRTWDITDSTVTNGPAYTLPSFDPGCNLTGYGAGSAPIAAALNTVAASPPTSTVLADGSLLILGTRRSCVDPETGESGYPAGQVPGAYRVVLDDEAHTATATPIAGTEFDNSGSAYTALHAGPDGLVALTNDIGAARVQTLTVSGSGAVENVDPPVTVPYVGGELRTSFNIALDPSDGTLWWGGRGSQRLIGVRDGELVSSAYYPERSARGGPVVVGADHQIYSLTTGGVVVLGSSMYSVTRFDLTGTTPTVTTQPEPATASLNDDEESAEATFTVAASGRPAATIQWQLKRSGADRFTSLAGQTGTTATVPAGRDLQGSQVRAVLTNPAGRVATEPVALTVNSAPRIATAPTDQTVVEGNDATFELVAGAHPAPQVTWQRRVSGFWQSITAEDDGFVLHDDSQSLTVVDTNVDQTASLFRAKLVNAVATTYTPAVTLTVTKAASPTRAITGGAMDWGVKQSFRSYVAGPIAHGAVAATDGATLNADGTCRFPVLGGTYTATGGKAEVRLGGTVRFTGHDSGSGPALDLKITDPELRLTAATGALVANVTSKNMETGQTMSYPDVVLASLDASHGVAGGAATLGLSDLPATLTDAGAPAFAGFYTAGAALDPVDATLTLGDEVTGGTPGPVASVTTMTLDRRTYAYGTSTVAQVRVVPSGTQGAVPAGAVLLSVAGQTVSAELSGGAARVRLPEGIKPGRHTVTARYGGGAKVASSSMTASLRVTKADPKLRLKVAGRSHRAGQRLRVRVVADIAGSSHVYPVGQIVLREDGRTIATATLRSGHRGTITLKRPGLRIGKHFLTATLAGTRLQSAATSTAKVVRVVRSK